MHACMYVRVCAHVCIHLYDSRCVCVCGFAYVRGERTESIVWCTVYLHHLQWSWPGLAAAPRWASPGPAGRVLLAHPSPVGTWNQQLIWLLSRRSGGEQCNLITFTLRRPKGKWGIFFRMPIDDDKSLD